MGAERDQQNRVQSLINTGAQVTGSGLAAAAGAGIGHALTGPTGTVAGAAFGGAVGPLTTLMMKDMAYSALDFTRRMLGQREKVRVGAVVTYCYTKFSENVAAGHQIRQDDFFEDSPNERSADKEVFEGIMLAAQREHQEKKLRFFGNLVANIAFRPEVDRAHANHLIKVAEDLSYRQLCILSLIANRDLRSISLRQGNYRLNERGGGKFSIEMVGLLQEIHDLVRREMLTDQTGESLLLGMTDINPSTLRVQGTGTGLYQLMELRDVDTQDLAPLIRLLQ